MFVHLLLWHRACYSCKGCAPKCLSNGTLTLPTSSAELVWDFVIVFCLLPLSISPSLPLSRPIFSHLQTLDFGSVLMDWQTVFGTVQWLTCFASSQTALHSAQLFPAAFSVALCAPQSAAAHKESVG